MDTGLAGRVAIVAGGSQGLGRACALALAREGASLAICARGNEALSRAAAELRNATGVDVLAESVDVRDSGAVAAFVEKVADRFGRIDVCVTNAGGPPARAFLETTAAEWQDAFELNLRSTVDFARCVLPSMQQRRWGRLVAITSLASKQPLPRLVLSNAVRSGMLGLVRSLSNEFAKDGITVNSVAPGYTATARLKELSLHLAQESRTSVEHIEQEWIANIPAGRLGAPEEVADAVVWLASERAAFVTGQTILVDGGMYKGV